MTYEEKTLSSERIYEGTIINLRRDEVTVKDGNTSFREIVEHRGGVVIVGITPDGKVPMVTQYRKAAERDVLEVPAGKLDPGEEDRHEEAALRELREETGYTAGTIRYVASAYSSIGYSTEVLHYFVAEDLTPGQTDFDDNEAIEISLVPLDELVRMAASGQIVDGKSITAIFLANELLR
jgi:ADP-ribose pyrophosphatase